MNKKLQVYARMELKLRLAECAPCEQRIFKLMYAYDNMELDINDVVDLIEEEKLSWSMQQVENTLEKRGAEAGGDVMELIASIDAHLGINSHIKLDPSLLGTKLLKKARLALIKLSIDNESI